MLWKEFLSHASSFYYFIITCWNKTSSEWWTQNIKVSTLLFYSTMQCIWVFFVFLKGHFFFQNECLRKGVLELEKLIVFSIFFILSLWVYLWLFQNHITNPKKQLYNKKYFLALGLLHNIIHIWCGRDYTIRQQEPTHPGGPL